MSDMQKGGCHCGAMKLSFPVEAQFTFSCHCNTCQKLVSGGRLLGFGIPEDRLSVEGDVSTYNYAGGGGSGSNIALSFCPVCSTQVFADPASLDGVIVVRSNALENPSAFEPDEFIFTESACAWDKTSLVKGV